MGGIRNLSSFRRLGSAAALDASLSGDASSSQVVKGNDSRLSGGVTGGVVVNKTADATLTVSGVYANTGASGDIALTFPSAVVDTEITMVCKAAHYIKGIAAGTDVFNIGSGTASAAGGYVRINELESSIKFRCYAAGVWTCISRVGSWSVDL